MFPIRERHGAAVLLAALLGVLVTPGAAPASPARTSGGEVTAPGGKVTAPAGACPNAADPGTIIRQIPWAQALLAPQQLQPLSTGSGITVAVIDSGVDALHPQLTGSVLPGFDFLRNQPGGNFDCTSHGTAVASLIAARHLDGVGFQGLAPDAQILPIRVSEHEDTGAGNAVTPDVFAQAIRYAADQGARIINVSMTLDADYPAVAQAVNYAQKNKGCLIVAAVGNHHTAGASPPSSPAALGSRGSTPIDPPSYPSAYPGVLGVGAIDENGGRLGQSQVGPYVDVMAPGGNVLAATRIQGYAYWSGTSMAAPLVSAAAALVWAASPQLHNTDVAWRLETTADRMPGPAHGPEFGYGLVSPYRALTEPLPPTGATQPTAVPGAIQDPAAAARAATWRRAGQVARVVAVLAVVLTAAGALFAVALRRGRARRWRPGAAPSPPVRQRVDEPEKVFFALPRRGSP